MMYSLHQLDAQYGNFAFIIVLIIPFRHRLRELVNTVNTINLAEFCKSMEMVLVETMTSFVVELTPQFSIIFVVYII